MIKTIHPNFELNHFYAKQLHEYEPILQVQRTLLYDGNSCSRHLRSAVLKRKFDERHREDLGVNPLPPVAGGGCSENLWIDNRLNNMEIADVLME